MLFLADVRQEILDEEQLAFYLVDMLKKAAPYSADGAL